MTVRTARLGPFLLVGWLLGVALVIPQRISEFHLVPQTEALLAEPPPTTAPSLEHIIWQAAVKYQVHPALIAAMIEVESAWNPGAVSPKGAMGLMQLMPQTARRMGVQRPFDIAANIFGGVKYFRQLLDQFHGNYLLALAAYNAGPDAVQRYGTIPPFSETIQYLPKVAYWYRHYDQRIRATQTGKKHRAAPVAKQGPWYLVRNA